MYRLRALPCTSHRQGRASMVMLDGEHPMVCRQLLRAQAQRLSCGALQAMGTCRQNRRQVPPRVHLVRLVRSQQMQRSSMAPSHTALASSTQVCAFHLSLRRASEAGPAQRWDPLPKIMKMHQLFCRANLAVTMQPNTHCSLAASANQHQSMRPKGLRLCPLDDWPPRQFCIRCWCSCNFAACLDHASSSLPLSPLLHPFCCFAVEGQSATSMYSVPPGVRGEVTGWQQGWL